MVCVGGRSKVWGVGGWVKEVWWWRSHPRRWSVPAEMWESAMRSPRGRGEGTVRSPRGRGEGAVGIHFGRKRRILVHLVTARWRGGEGRERTEGR